MRTALVTAVHGRSTHLRNQLKGLQRSNVRVDSHVIVAIDDDDVLPTVRSHDASAAVIPFTSPTQHIPMAAARNQGAQAAIDDGAELLIFLDVDCIPSPDLVHRYLNAAQHPDHGSGLLCGPVTYLPPPADGGYDLTQLEELAGPHPARPVPAEGDILPSTEYALFWSLSFAVTTAVWQRIGGFCTDYTGYGGEDTDFAQKAAARAIAMSWVGGAHAFHQFHPISNPPTEHLTDIVANAAVFQRRWGWWPMAGWLDAFEADGLITRDDEGRPQIK